MKSPLVGAALLAALSLAPACSSSAPTAQPAAARPVASAPRAQPAGRRAQPPAPRGGPAITRHDTPYQQVLAEARSTGRPSVLYFWTSW